MQFRPLSMASALGGTLRAFAKLGFELGVEWLLAMRADPNVADRAEAAARALCGYPRATLGSGSLAPIQRMRVCACVFVARECLP